MNGPAFLGVVLCLCLAGCAGTPTQSTPTATAEAPPELPISSESDRAVDVLISHRENGTVILNGTYDLETGETVRFGQTLTRPSYYHVRITVEEKDQWERTVVPSQAYHAEIDRDGNIRVAM